MKKLTIKEFDKEYIQINKEILYFEDYPTKEQLKLITGKYNHFDNKNFQIAYMGDFASIQFGEIGRYRIDGITFGFNAYIFTIDKEV